MSILRLFDLLLLMPPQTRPISMTKIAAWSVLIAGGLAMLLLRSLSLQRELAAQSLITLPFA